MSAPPVEQMPIDSAIAINGRLTEAYLVRAGMRSGPAPSLRGIRLIDALRAADQLRGQPRKRRGDGSEACATVVASSEIARLYAWAVLQGQMT